MTDGVNEPVTSPFTRAARTINGPEIMAWGIEGQSDMSGRRGRRFECGEKMDLTELERRIIAIQDIEAIKQLKAEYSDACDDNHFRL